MDRNRRLLSYLPDSTWSAYTADVVSDDELADSTALLEAAEAGRLPAFSSALVASIHPSGRALLATPAGRMLGRALACLARSIWPSSSAELKRRAAMLFGLELEGLSPEDKEFEYARHLARFMRDAVQSLETRGGMADAERRVQDALAQAARRHAPGLLRHGCWAMASAMDADG